MSGRRGETSGTSASVAAAQRQNEYFVPRDGIDREVITADICRYLGNDALVRPGIYTDPSSGRNIQGYFITAYRNLTTAMIQDLKADSARWEQERRSHSGARYTDSSYRMSGATATTTGSSPYPGNDTPGYSASNVAPPSYPPQQYDNRPYNSQYPQGLGQYPSPQPADVRYSTPGSTQPYSTQPYTNSPVNQAEPPYYNVNSNRITSQQQGGYDQQDPRMVDTSSSRVHPQGTYPGQPQQDPRYYSQGQLPGGNVYSSQSVDPFLGRSNNFPSSQADYTSSAPSVSYQYVTDAPQFESNQTPPPSTSQAQPGHSGSSHSRRDRERDSYSKSSSDRHHRRPPPQ